MLTTFNEVFRYRELVKNLVSRDLKIKYKSSVLGFLWSLLNPLLMLIVYTLAFKYVLRVGKEDFAFYFIVAYLPWNFFALSLAISVGAIVDNASLLKKVYFPREILPLSIVLSNFVQFLLTFVVLVPAFLYFNHSLGLSVLLLPALMVLHIVFTLGIAMILATLYVYFRDTRHLLEVVLNLWFWVTPIVYTFDTIKNPQIIETLQLNPMTLFVMAYRDILYSARMPDLLLLAELLAWSLAALMFGAGLFGRYKFRFAEAI